MLGTPSPSNHDCFYIFSIAGSGKSLKNFKKDNKLRTILYTGKNWNEGLSVILSEAKNLMPSDVVNH